MNKKTWIYAAIFAPFLVLVGWTVMTVNYRSTASEIVLPVRGYDPRDLLSGHYIQFQIDWDRADCRQFPNGQCDRQAFERNRFGERFYIPEKRASELNAMFRRRNTENRVFSVIYAYEPGKPAIKKNLLINGQEWSEYLKNPK